MAWEDYCYKTHGYFIRQARDREPLRLIATILFNANVDKKDRITAEKLMPLFTDNLHKVKVDPNELKKQKAEQKLRAQEHVKKLNEKKAAEYERGRGNERQSRS